MSPEDVARLAAAIAKANGHSHPEEWAAKVVEAWNAQDDEAPDAPSAPARED